MSLGIRKRCEGASQCRFTYNRNQTFHLHKLQNGALSNATVTASLTSTVSGLGLVLVTSCQAAVRGVHFLFLCLRFSLLARTCLAVHLCRFYCSGGGSALCCLQVAVLRGLLAVVKESGPAFEPLFPLAGRLLHLSRQRPQQGCHNMQWRSNAGRLIFSGRGSSPQSRFQRPFSHFSLELAFGF